MGFKLRSQNGPGDEQYNKDTKQFEGFDKSSDTLVKGSSRYDLNAARSISRMNAGGAALKLSGKSSGSYFSPNPTSEKAFQNPDGGYTYMASYKKEDLKKSVK